MYLIYISAFILIIPKANSNGNSSVIQDLRRPSDIKPNALDNPLSSLLLDEGIKRNVTIDSKDISAVNSRVKRQYYGDGYTPYPRIIIIGGGFGPAFGPRGFGGRGFGGRGFGGRGFGGRGFGGRGFGGRGIGGGIGGAGIGGGGRGGRG